MIYIISYYLAKILGKYNYTDKIKLSKYSINLPPSRPLPHKTPYIPCFGKATQQNDSVRIQLKTEMCSM